MGESFAKKELNKKKAKKKQEKAQKVMDRRGSAGKKSLEDMMAYVDEFGNITDTPPDATAKKQEINPDDIILGAAPREPEETLRTGTVLFFDDAKGYGFISDDKTAEKLFVHSSGIMQPIAERDKVTFEKEKTPRGFSAVLVKKIN